MKFTVRGQVFPHAKNAAEKVVKIGEKRRIFNIGSQSRAFSVYEVEMPTGSEANGNYIKTPSGTRLYHNKAGQYEPEYLISEEDSDPLALRHFGGDCGDS